MTEAQTASFQEVSKEQLRQELLNAALTIDQLQQKLAVANDEKLKLEHSVQELFRQNQWLADELKEGGQSESNNNGGNNNNNESLNTSLADELGLDEPTVEATAAARVNTPSKSIFSDMKIATTAEQPGEKLFSEMEVKQRDDRQYRDYVYMSLSAIKIAMAIKELAPSEMLLKLSAKKVYDKAIERRIPLVRQFISSSFFVSDLCCSIKCTTLCASTLWPTWST